MTSISVCDIILKEDKFMEINVGISNRHVHLKKETLDLLFGKNFELEIQKEGSKRAN